MTSIRDQGNRLTFSLSLPGGSIEMQTPRRSYDGRVYDAHGNLIGDLRFEYEKPKINNMPSAPPTAGPGALLKRAIQAITGETPSSNCACNRRSAQMNDWGWWGCWRRRDTIANWLVEEAAKRGHQVTPSAALTLLRAAWKEARQSRSKLHVRP